MSNRSFVFEDYTWSHTPFPYTIYDFALRPKRIPLNAFISGPTAGGPMPSSTHLNSPRAISAEWWETVCPERKRHIVSSKDAPSDVEGDVLIDWWVRRLERVKEGCVEIDSSSRDVFDKLYVSLDCVKWTIQTHLTPLVASSAPPGFCPSGRPSPPPPS